VGAGGVACDTFCIGEIVDYTVTNTPGNIYNWTIFGGTIVSGLGTNTVGVIWNVSTMECGQLCVDEINPAGCSAKDCARGVAAYPNGTVSISASPNPVCLNTPVNFNYTTTGGPFTWFS